MSSLDVAIAGEINLDLILYGLPPEMPLERELLATMEQVNATLEAHEVISKIFISKDAWSIDNNLMTPTMKVRRNEVEKRFGEEVQACESRRDVKVVWEA